MELFEQVHEINSIKFYNFSAGKYCKGQYRSIWSCGAEKVREGPARALDAKRKIQVLTHKASCML